MKFFDGNEKASKVSYVGDANKKAAALVNEVEPGHEVESDANLLKNVKTLEDLYEIVNVFSQHADRIISRALSDDKLFPILFLNEAFPLSKFSKYFPEQTGILLRELLKDDEKFECLIHCCEDFSLCLMLFSGWETALIKRIFASEEIFKRVVQCGRDIYSLASSHYELGEVFLNYVLKNDNYFEHVIHCVEDIYHIQRVFPQQANDILCRVLNDDRIFNCVLKTTRDFDCIAIHFNEYESELVDGLLRNKNNPFLKGLILSCDFEKLERVFQQHHGRVVEYISRKINIDIYSKNRIKIINYAHKYLNFNSSSRLTKVALLHDVFETKYYLDKIKKFTIKLKELYGALNPIAQYRTHTHFVFANLFKFKYLYTLFGKDIFDFLMDNMVDTPIPLEQIFERYNCLDNESVRIFKSILKHDQLAPTAPELMDLIAEFNIFNSIYQKERSQFFNKFSFDNVKSVRQLTELIRSTSLYSLRRALGLNKLEIDINKLGGNLLPKRLLMVLDSMNQNENKLRDLFLEMLRADLRKGSSFNRFVHEISKNTLLGISIAKHNKRCEDELWLAGINTELALNYDKVEEIVFDSVNNPTEDYMRILEVIDQLDEVAPGSYAGTNLKSDISKFKVAFYRDSNVSADDLNSEILGRLIRDPYAKLLNQIIATSHRLLERTIFHDDSVISKLNRNPYAKLLNQIVETSGRFPEWTIFHDERVRFNIDEIQRLSNLLEVGINKISEKKHHKFCIVQWDKNDIDTLLLGDYLNCSLATDRSDFEELLRRRIDQSCFIHVVIDTESNEPVCGSWLFFGKHRDSEELVTSDVYVVANDIKISDRFKHHVEIRDFLVQSLCEYTMRFTKEVNASELIVRSFKYGSTSEITLGKIKMPIKKVGGYFDIVTLKTVQNCTQHLLAVHQDEFYCASDRVHEARNVNGQQVPDVVVSRVLL